MKKKDILYPVSCFSGYEVTSPFEQRFFTEEKANQNISSIQATEDATQPEIRPSLTSST